MPRTFLKPATIAAFLVGVFLGASAIAIHSCATTISKGMASRGAPQISFEDEARARIASYGLKIPADAKTPYYYVDGFQDHTVFIAFSADSETAESAVRDYGKVGFFAFEPWTNQIDSNTGGIREPGVSRTPV